MRQLEVEIMQTMEEVEAYDLLTRKYLRILHAGFVETVINMSPLSGSFLDVGTGTGWIAIGVAKHTSGVDVTAIDLSDTMLKVAGNNAKSEGVQDKLRFMNGDAKGLPFEDATFDAVFCHNMLHHLPEPAEMVAEMIRVAKSDGAVIIRDLLRHSPLVTELHVNILGLTYSKMMKKEYRDSILAALSLDEWQELFKQFSLPRSYLTRQFITHLTLARPTTTRRSVHIQIPTPRYLKPFKNLYVS